MIKPGDIYLGDPSRGKVSHTYGIYLVIKEKDKHDRHLCLNFCGNGNQGSLYACGVAAAYLDLCELIASVDP